jgi:signal transduction histidine kinase
VRSALLTSAAGAVQRILPRPSAGLDWPRRSRPQSALSVEERGRLQHYERLIGLAHLTVVPLALAATLVRVDYLPPPQTPWLASLLGGTLVYAVVYHFVLPRAWLSHAKVVIGLCVDALITTEVVRLTGYHMSLLVFLYYLIVIAGALTLETRTLYAICALISVLFCAALPLDPLFVGAASAQVGHVVLFVVSVWLVGLISGGAAVQIQGAEKRLMDSLATQRAIAAENAQLSVELARQLEASQSLAASLERQREETRRLADMLIRAQEDERRRVARELHDEANQTLAALMTTIDAAESVGRRQGGAELLAALQRLRRLASAALSDLQRIATELRPPALDEFGLLPALTRHVRDRTEATSLSADVDVEGRRHRLEPAVEVALYRIAQEALANVQKHSQARCVHLRLRYLPHTVRLDISDDGVGFDSADDGDGGRPRLGIAGMRERASIVGGTVDVTTRPGGGTRVSASIPVERAAELHAMAGGGA